MTETLSEARRLLKEHFGYDSFRPAQETLITALTGGRDALGIMPTGAGKSMCYQIPALLLPGITLVISPLISLMQDQVRALKAGPHREDQGERSLYDLLRSIRKDFADRASLPPELIFSDRTLRAMAAERPRNEHDMLELPGVSPVKYQMYGKPFLRAIQRNSHRRSGVN